MLRITAGDHGPSDSFTVSNVHLAVWVHASLCQIDWLIEFTNVADEEIAEAVVSVPIAEGVSTVNRY